MPAVKERATATEKNNADAAATNSEAITTFIHENGLDPGVVFFHVLCEFMLAEEDKAADSFLRQFKKKNQELIDAFPISEQLKLGPMLVFLSFQWGSRAFALRMVKWWHTDLSMQEPLQKPCSENIEADIRTSFGDQFTKPGKKSLLHYAVQHCHIEAVLYLLQLRDASKRPIYCANDKDEMGMNCFALILFATTTEEYVNLGSPEDRFVELSQIILLPQYGVSLADTWSVGDAWFNSLQGVAHVKSENHRKGLEDSIRIQRPDEWKKLRHKPLSHPYLNGTTMAYYAYRKWVIAKLLPQARASIQQKTVQQQPNHPHDAIAAPFKNYYAHKTKGDCHYYKILFLERQNTGPHAERRRNALTIEAIQEYQEAFKSLAIAETTEDGYLELGDGSRVDLFDFDKYYLSGGTTGIPSMLREVGMSEVFRSLLNFGHVLRTQHFSPRLVSSAKHIFELTKKYTNVSETFDIDSYPSDKINDVMKLSVKKILIFMTAAFTAGLALSEQGAVVEAEKLYYSVYHVGSACIKIALRWDTCDRIALCTKMFACCLMLGGTHLSLRVEGRPPEYSFCDEEKQYKALLFNEPIIPRSFKRKCNCGSASRDAKLVEKEGVLHLPICPAVDTSDSDQLDESSGRRSDHTALIVADCLEAFRSANTQEEISNTETEMKSVFPDPNDMRLNLEEQSTHLIADVAQKLMQKHGVVQSWKEATIVAQGAIYQRAQSEVASDDLTKSERKMLDFLGQEFINTTVPEEAKTIHTCALEKVYMEVSSGMLLVKSDPQFDVNFELHSMKRLVTAGIVADVLIKKDDGKFVRDSVSTSKDPWPLGSTWREHQKIHLLFEDSASSSRNKVVDKNLNTDIDRAIYCAIKAQDAILRGDLLVAAIYWDIRLQIQMRSSSSRSSDFVDGMLKLLNCCNANKHSTTRSTIRSPNPDVVLNAAKTHYGCAIEIAEDSDFLKALSMFPHSDIALGQDTCMKLDKHCDPALVERVEFHRNVEKALRYHNDVSANAYLFQANRCLSTLLKSWKTVGTSPKECEEAFETAIAKAESSNFVNFFKELYDSFHELRETRFSRCEYIFGVLNLFETREERKSLWSAFGFDDKSKKDIVCSWVLLDSNEIYQSYISHGDIFQGDMKSLLEELCTGSEPAHCESSAEGKEGAIEHDVNSILESLKEAVVYPLEGLPSHWGVIHPRFCFDRDSQGKNTKQTGKYLRYLRAMIKGSVTKQQKSIGVKNVDNKIFEIKINGDFRLYTDVKYQNEHGDFLIVFDREENHEGIKRVLRGTKELRVVKCGNSSTSDAGDAGSRGV